MYQPREQFHSGTKFGIEFGGTVLSFDRVGNVLRRQWPLIATAVGGSLALVIVYLALAKPMYTANARIMMDTRQTQVLDKEGGTIASTEIPSSPVAAVPTRDVT